MSATDLAYEAIELERSLKTGMLSLRNYGLAEVPPSVFELSHLMRLDLSQNHIRVLPPAINQLSGLRELYLQENELECLPPEIGELFNLEGMDIGLNSIRELPTTLSNLGALEYLRLGSNPFGVFPNSVAHLRNLRMLIANDLSLGPFPDEVTQLHNLRILNLAHNRIEELPRDFVKLSSLEVFVLDGNPLRYPPIEIVSRGPGAIVNYLHAFHTKGKVFKIREAKLLIVGRGEVGKTLLMKRIIYDKVDQSGKTTEGIEISRWNIDAGDHDSFRINFWDFGGQEIYHATHQFFLTKRSLYMFVWDARKEDNILDFDYWLNTIQLLGHSSPVLVVLNKIDERIKTVDEDSLQRKFPNIKSFHKVSALTGAGIPELRDAIKTRIVTLEHVGDMLPKEWTDIRKCLEDLDEPYIPCARYCAICAKYGLDEARAHYLSQYYHDLGVFLHFQDNPLLTQIVFLKPQWATNAVYKLVDTKSVQTAFGRFSLGELGSIWHEYPKQTHPHLLELMKRFELCFQIPHSDEYVAPELLSASRPRFHWDDKDNLCFFYTYEFMPAGIMTRFIVRTHDMNRSGIYWRNGTLLNRERADALVISEPLNRRLVIRIRGLDKGALLAVIRREVDYIHKTLNNPDVATVVPCKCYGCRKSEDPYLHDFEYLKKAKAIRKWTVECKKSLEDVPINDILSELRDPSHAPAKQVNVFGGAYYENAHQAATTIMVGSVHIRREYSDELCRAIGLSAEDFRKTIVALSSLPEDYVMKLRSLLQDAQVAPRETTMLGGMKAFIDQHKIPVLQNLSASALYELLKYLFL